jgi:hypothetical protein
LRLGYILKIVELPKYTLKIKENDSKSNTYVKLLVPQIQSNRRAEEFGGEKHRKSYINGQQSAPL